MAAMSKTSSVSPIAASACGSTLNHALGQAEQHGLGFAFEGLLVLHVPHDLRFSPRRTEVGLFFSATYGSAIVMSMNDDDAGSALRRGSTNRLRSSP